MAVREFDGTDDELRFAVDALSGMTFGTIACIFKPTSSAAGTHQMLALHTSGGTWTALIMGHQGSNNLVQLHNGTAFCDSPGSGVDDNVWHTVVYRKATGSAAGRFSIYDHTADVWTHTNGSTAIANWSSAGASGTVRTSFESSSEFFQGRLAVAGVWSNEVHWTADASGDTAIEAAGLETALANWVTEAPDALWRFNQDPVSAVNDLIGDADQTAVTGTTAITGDDPPGFTFSLGGFVDLESTDEVLLESGSIFVLEAGAPAGAVTGIATASLVFSGTAAGVPETFGTAVATLTFTATAAGIDRAIGTAAAALTFTGTASGVAGNPPVEGQALAALTFTGIAAGTPRTPGVALAAFGFTGSASGVPRTRGAATGTYAFTAAAVGIARALGAATASFGFVAIATGIPETFGAAAAALTFTATASGITGAPPVTGQATATLTFSATAAGIDRAIGTAASSLVFSATAAGIPDVHGTAVAPFTVTATAIGQRKTFAQATAALAFSATGSAFVGAIPVPTGHPLVTQSDSHSVTVDGGAGLVTVAAHAVTTIQDDHTVEVS